MCLDIWGALLDHLVTSVEVPGSQTHHCEQYRSTLVSMASSVLEKIQFNCNIDELREIDDDTIDDDVSVMSLLEHTVDDVSVMSLLEHTVDDVSVMWSLLVVETGNVYSSSYYMLTSWLHHAYIMLTSWLHHAYILVTSWLHHAYIMVTSSYHNVLCVFV